MVIDDACEVGTDEAQASGVRCHERADHLVEQAADLEVQPGPRRLPRA